MNESKASPAGLRCWTETSVAALRANAAELTRCAGPLIAVIKANAYGHGTAHAVAALAGSVAMFGVANLAEAREVRELDTKTPILILSAVLGCEREAVVKEGFIAVVSSSAEAAEFAKYGDCDLHFTVDTGMGRMGDWWCDALHDAAATCRLPGVRLRGFCSHFSCADSDAEFSMKQLSEFTAAFEQFWMRVEGFAPQGLVVHFFNSAAALRYLPAGKGAPTWLTRAGLALYGVPPLREHQSSYTPALAWKTRVVLVRELGPGRTVSYGATFTTTRPTTVATLAVGYADGFPRQMSGQNASVLIGGARCPVLGRITMDQIMVDVTGVAGVVPGTEAVLLGRQGDEEITTWELAEKAGTIPWDILVGIGARVPRIAV